MSPPLSMVNEYGNGKRGPVMHSLPCFDPNRVKKYGVVMFNLRMPPIKMGMQELLLKKISQ